MRLHTNLICLDIETTDIDSTFGSVIQIGAIAINEKFEKLDSFKTYLKPLHSHRNSAAMAVNRISEDTLSNAPTITDAFEMFETFTLQYDDYKRKPLLAAWGNYFDIPFLKAQYDKIRREWPFGHKSIDLKSIAIWEFGKRNIPFSGGIGQGLKYLNLEFDGVYHDGLDDIKNTVTLLQTFARQDCLKMGWDI